MMANIIWKAMNTYSGTPTVPQISESAMKVLVPWYWVGFPHSPLRSSPNATENP
jgi:hypothetical protein